MFVRKTIYIPSWLKDGEVAVLIFIKHLKSYFIEDKVIRRYSNLQEMKRVSVGFFKAQSPSKLLAIFK